MIRTRADQLLVARGLVTSRARAQAEIAAGHVLSDGLPVERASALLADDVALTLTDALAFVSRGALKLAHALDHFGIDPSGMTALDIGASTGGFTELMLTRGAARVFAVDVGHGQLHPKLAADPRVISLEGRDARTLTRDDLGAAVDLAAVDVSFIGLAKILSPVLECLRPGGTLVALIKPQFEVGPGGVGKGGIVRDASRRREAVDGVRSWLSARADVEVMGVIDSPILGGDGNAESLLAARRL